MYPGEVLASQFVWPVSKLAVILAINMTVWTPSDGLHHANDKLASASASASTPFLISIADANSSGLCENPLWHGMNNIPVGATSDMKSESWYARETIRLELSFNFLAAASIAFATLGAHVAGGSAFTIS